MARVQLKDSARIRAYKHCIKYTAISCYEVVLRHSTLRSANHVYNEACTTKRRPGWKYEYESEGR